MVTIKTAQARRARGTFSIRTLVALQENYRVRSVALFLARLAVASVFIYHGAGKLFNYLNQGGIAGTTAFFKFEGIPAPHLFAYVGGITEFFGGLLLLVGLAVPLAGLALTIDMLIALLAVTVNNGMFSKALPGGIVADGMQINLALGAAALLLAALGAGMFSLDYLLGLAWRPGAEVVTP
jgi:putative oxidoreductase